MTSFRPMAMPALLGLLLAQQAGCRTPEPQSVWREEMAETFGRTSVRPDDPPRHLWSESDVDLFQRRLGYADCAAVGTTRVVTVYSTFSAPRQLALAFHPEQIIHGSLKGELDGDGDLILQLTPSQDDFRLAVQVQGLLPGTHYLVFLKRQPQNGLPPVWHWALYRDDPQIIREARAAYDLLRSQKRGK